MSRTRIKICGLTREADVDDAIDAGADALGFVLYAKSPRHVSLARAAELVARLPPFVTPVLLLVNASPHEISRAVATLPQALLQFHGDESPEDCAAAGHIFIRAARMRPQAVHGAGQGPAQGPGPRQAAPAGLDGPGLLDFAQRFHAAQALLLDTHVEAFGGAGKVFDWSLIPPSVPLPVVLSGGLHPANVTDGIVRVRPWAVDVSSGVELGKGIKSGPLMRRFCKAVRDADERLNA